MLVCCPPTYFVGLASKLDLQPWEQKKKVCPMCSDLMGAGSLTCIPQTGSFAISPPSMTGWSKNPSLYNTKSLHAMTWWTKAGAWGWRTWFGHGHRGKMPPVQVRRFRSAKTEEPRDRGVADGVVTAASEA